MIKIIKKIKYIMLFYMGLIRFALYFLIGNFFLTAVEKHSHLVKDIYLVGPIYGDRIDEYIQNNMCSLVVVFMSLLALVL